MSVMKYVPVDRLSNSSHNARMQLYHARVAVGQPADDEVIVIPLHLRLRWNMPAVVAQSGGYGPQVVALLSARQAMTREMLIREADCHTEWLDAWLRPPYFTLGKGWTWTVTSLGVEAVHQSIFPPHLMRRMG